MTVGAQSTWQAMPSAFTNPNGQRFDDVFFLDENIGWSANGFYAAVYKTTDGGTTWSEQLNQDDLGGSYYFRTIEFLNSNIGFLGTLNGAVFKTDDGGVTWAQITNITPNPAAICGLSAVGPSTIYGCGAYFTPAVVIKSTDSGNQWQSMDLSTYAEALVDIHFITETLGYATGRSASGGVILKTEDGGASWIELYNTNIIGEYVWKIQVFETDPNIIFASVESVSSNSGKLLKSNDGGTTWISLDAPETGIQAVGFISETHGWMGGHTTGFYETIDGGLTWSNLNIGNNLNRIFIISSAVAYTSGTTIYKYTPESLGTQAFTTNEKSPLNIDLITNPVSNELKFTINFEADDNLLIELYDNSGKFIKQLSREIIKTQRKLKYYNISLKDLASGLYYLDFHNNSGRQSIKFIKK